MNFGFGAEVDGGSTYAVIYMMRFLCNVSLVVQN